MRNRKILLIPLFLIVLAIALGALAESMEAAESPETGKTDLSGGFFAEPERADQDAEGESAEDDGQAPAEAENRYRRVIADEAWLLKSSAEAAEVLEAMKGVAEYCHVGFFTTTQSGDWKTKARNWGFKEFGDEDYTVFCIDMDTRRVGIYSSDTVHRAITTGKANTITDNVYRKATAGEYGACAIEAFEQMAAVLEGRKIAEPMRYISNAMVAVAGAILLAYLIINAKMQQEEEVGLADIVKVTAAGVGTAILANVVTRKVVHQSSSGGSHHGGGFSGGGHHGGGGGSHGF